jgi:hypothetical protein
MTKTARIAALLKVIAEHGYWTEAEQLEVEDIMGRDAGYIPEGTEGWMQEDGVPRAYDKPRRFEPGQEVELSLTPLRGQHVHYDAETEKFTAVPAGTTLANQLAPIDLDARFKTIEATLTDVVRRLKALEERVIDPSA